MRLFINKLSFKTPYNSFNTCFSRLALVIEFTNWNRNVRAVPSRVPVWQQVLLGEGGKGWADHHRIWLGVGGGQCKRRRSKILVIILNESQVWYRFPDKTTFQCRKSLIKIVLISSLWHKKTGPWMSSPVESLKVSGNSGVNNKFISASVSLWPSLLPPRQALVEI